MVVVTRGRDSRREEFFGRLWRRSSLERVARGSPASLEVLHVHCANPILQDERLWIADPKAIHHILQGTSYLYQRPSYFSEILESVFDKGLVSVEGVFPAVPHVIQPLTMSLGNVHKRQRRAMAPAFGLVEAKALYPYFSRGSNYVSYRPIIYQHSVITQTEHPVTPLDSSPINGTILFWTQDLDRVRPSM